MLPDLTAIHDLTAAHPYQRDLASVAARMAGLTSALLTDLGEPGKARHWLAVTDGYAQQAGDARTLTWGHAARAVLETYYATPAQVLTVTGQAIPAAHTITCAGNHWHPLSGHDELSDSRGVVNDDHKTAGGGGCCHRRSYSERLISGRNDHRDVRAGRVRHGPEIAAPDRPNPLRHDWHRLAVPTLADSEFCFQLHKAAKGKTVRVAALTQLAGRFRRMWLVVDSNHRRRSRRFTARRSYPRPMPLTSTYTVRGAVPRRRRPLCVRAHRAWSTDGDGKPMDGAVGAVTPIARPAFVPLTWHFRMPARCRHLPCHRVRNRARCRVLRGRR